MDERGFIFTADASLALIVIIIVSASITAYLLAPYFMGQDHQHLQALASDTLEIMEKDGTLYTAAVKYNQGDAAGANLILNERLSVLIPTDTAYNLTMMGNSASDPRGLMFATDTATAVKVISGPNEGYLGRAWYKQEAVEFQQLPVNVTTTVWNFHNYLSNFQPWQNYGLYNRQYWGVSGTRSPGNPVNIGFSIPNDAVITGGMFLQGTNNASADSLNDPSFGVEVDINGHKYGNTTPFTMLYSREQGTRNLVYNYKGIIDPAHLNPGSNNFYVYFNYQNMLKRDYSYNMPWFSLLADYTTNIIVPVGILNTSVQFPDAAGLAKPNNNGGYYGKQYDLNTGTVTNVNQYRVMNWNTYRTNKATLNNYDNGVPFVIDNLPGVTGTGHGSAVSITQNIYIPETNSYGLTPQIFDGYVNINAYAAVDGALVEVSNDNGATWRTAFCSFDFEGQDNTARSDGYGNTPGMVYIKEDQNGNDLLIPGNNLVRVTVWDHVPSNDYDLVGLVDCKAYAYYTFFPINWENFVFKNYQAQNSNTNPSYTFDRNLTNNALNFNIRPEATNVYLFLGTSTTSQNIRVEVRNTTAGWVTLYDSTTIPFYLDLAYLDAATGAHRFTKGPATNYTLNNGTYQARVTLTAPPSWESGDGGTSPTTYGNPTIFSGTRIAVLYPKFISNAWSTQYNSDANVAKQLAIQELIRSLQEAGFSVDPNLIKSEAIYAGDMPNSIPVRLDLWKQ